MSVNGMVVTPHHLASSSGLKILRKGGNAIEAMVSAAATISVVYPHMNGLGGDGFWIIMFPKEKPIAIDASGFSGSLANIKYFNNKKTIPYRGPQSALTIAGTVSGWEKALNLIKEKKILQSFSIYELLNDAINYASNGFPITLSQSIMTESKKLELINQPGFSKIFLKDNKNIYKPGDLFFQPELAKTLINLSKDGLDSFYRGETACKIAKGMLKLNIPITLNDLMSYRAQSHVPLYLSHSKGKIWNTMPPTQGFVALVILGIIDNLSKINYKKESHNIHYIVEATKIAFFMRDKYITDPIYMNKNLQSLLSKDYLKSLFDKINKHKATDFLYNSFFKNDTVWMGAIDKNGIAVSFIQSIYHEFGSGVVIPKTGILWNNRGSSFVLEPKKILTLFPKKKPFHTLCPSLAILKNGKLMVYGSMGGDGQPQTQATIFHRYVTQNIPLQDAISAPRWLFGRNWGKNCNTLKLENRFFINILKDLKKMGHNIEILSQYSEKVGHAGIIVRHSNGILEGAYDPRSNGSACGF
ncbi:gamma-glutamyltranspeptidase [Candidatus Tachikawaea gelatinosa]|uniref:Gamma-glutamyltranspeptidase n=2 Tax=Candidatus Tachikawaea gelatinosa TaxID=1410383 RepID=A0A090BWC0_9ENTR|nr:gamma-glutamyltranspeptidase [Candidatus Tachikawaea gelatinosa]